jgi:hypothetical protein
VIARLWIELQQTEYFAFTERLMRSAAVRREQELGISAFTSLREADHRSLSGSTAPPEHRHEKIKN